MGAAHDGTSSVLESPKPSKVSCEPDLRTGFGCGRPLAALPWGAKTSSTTFALGAGAVPFRLGSGRTARRSLAT